MTVIVNIILFPIDSIQLRRICDRDNSATPGDHLCDEFVKTAVIRVSELLMRFFGMERNDIRLISFDQYHAPASLILLDELGHHDAGSARLFDIDSFVCLFVRHGHVDWDRVCLHASEDLETEFWAIGLSERGDILRQEYARGRHLDGFFADNWSGVNERMFVDLFQAVRAVA